MFLLVCPCVCLFACLSVCLFVCLFVCLCVCLFVCLLACLFVCLFVCLAIPHRASQIARCASQLRIAGPKSQQKCHAVSNASHASLLTSPHRRISQKGARIAGKSGRQKHSDFIENSSKNEDKIKFGRSPRHEVVFHRSL